ncbi:mycofactocin-associated electron transfer flavoprotein alpha subunit [Actinosynnema sp. NPDC023794]
MNTTTVDPNPSAGDPVEPDVGGLAEVARQAGEAVDKRIAVVPVRDGVVPLGADEAVAEAGGVALIVGTGTRAAAEALCALVSGTLVEAGAFAPGRWARGLARALAAHHCVILPGSPDGRDLAPRLAAELGRPLLPGAVRVSDGGAEVVRWDGRVSVELAVEGPFVATLLPGVRGVHAFGGTPDLVESAADHRIAEDATSVEVLAPDPATADLAEAPRIFGAGVGLGDARTVAVMARVAAALGASTGATRAVTDADWADAERQIGTTGVVVNPELYVAFGVSGAVQHTSGLGDPAHVVSVNTDPSCPMTAMAHLGIVADAPAVLSELAARLGV